MRARRPTSARRPAAVKVAARRSRCSRPPLAVEPLRSRLSGRAKWTLRAAAIETSGLPPSSGQPSSSAPLKTSASSVPAFAQRRTCAHRLDECEGRHAGQAAPLPERQERKRKALQAGKSGQDRPLRSSCRPPRRSGRHARLTSSACSVARTAPLSCRRPRRSACSMGSRPRRRVRARYARRRTSTPPGLFTSSESASATTLHATRTPRSLTPFLAPKPRPPREGRVFPPSTIASVG